MALESDKSSASDKGLAVNESTSTSSVSMTTAASTHDLEFTADEVTLFEGGLELMMPGMLHGSNFTTYPKAVPANESTLTSDENLSDQFPGVYLLNPVLTAVNPSSSVSPNRGDVLIPQSQTALHCDGHSVIQSLVIHAT